MQTDLYENFNNEASQRPMMELLQWPPNNYGALEMARLIKALINKLLTRHGQYPTQLKES